MEFLVRTGTSQFSKDGRPIALLKGFLDLHR